jgi:ATP-dependent helicase/DNAse subunit B
MKEPGKYERMAIIREIEKLNEIKDPTQLKKQRKIVQEIKKTYEPMGLYEQMVKEAEQKTIDSNNRVYTSEEQNKSFNDFIEACERVTRILKDDKLYEQECQDWLNKTGRYAGK